MNQQLLLTEIKNYLSTFQLQVKISSKNNEYDINIHSENVMIPILNILYHSNLKNLNENIKNADSIDLLDTKSRIAFQITATHTLEKVKSTLSKLIKSVHFGTFDKLYVYVLTERQRSYSQAPLTKIIGKKIAFNAQTNIIDATDIYHKIQALTNIDTIKEIRDVLAKQFSELYLNQSYTRTDLNDFLNSYKKSCLTNFSRLNFFGISVSRKPREVELYKLFVRPRLNVVGSSRWLNNVFVVENFEMSIKAESYTAIVQPEFSIEDYIKYGYNQQSTETFENLFSFHKHIVVLGNPGAGKSSIVKYAICKILEKDLLSFQNQIIFDHIPFRVELHKYNQIRREKHIGFEAYLSQLLNEEYHSLIDENNIQQILSHFKTVVFFDGLDEIFDIQERIEMRNDIERTVKSFEMMRSIVTCRFESYTEVKLDSKLFRDVEVLNFDDHQMSDYVEKWYDVEENNSDIKKAEVKNCLNQLQNVDGELKFNPLLLSLILILYRNELEIPTSKLEIYENCTNTIVDHRDSKEKKLSFGLKITNPNSIFSALAHWQFEIVDNRSQVKHDDVALFVKNYLIEKGEFEDDFLASKATNQFLEFAKVRSIYFENKFTHKTFLEYFTAYYIFSTIFSKPYNYDKLEGIISHNIGFSSWTVVLELLICKIDSSQNDFEIINGIVESQTKANPKMATNFFLSICRYLKNISPKALVKIIEKGMEICLTPSPLSKSSKVDYVELIFSNILSLSGVKRFEQYMSTAFKNLFNKDSFIKEDLWVFAYEFKINSDNDLLVSLLKGLNGPKISPEIYLLQNYTALSNNDHFLSLIKSTMENFPQWSLQHIYQSKFSQKMFFGSDKFNYLATYLLRAQNRPLETSYNELRSIGVTYLDIKTSLSTQTALLNLSPNDIQLSVSADSNVNRELKNIVRTLLDTYVPHLTKKKTNEKFYDKFFLKHKRN